MPLGATAARSQDVLGKAQLPRRRDAVGGLRRLLGNAPCRFLLVYSRTRQCRRRSAYVDGVALCAAGFRRFAPRAPARDALHVE